MIGEPFLILLVEDEPAHAEIVRRNLEDFRVANRIVHLSDGQAALDYLFRQGSYADAQAFPLPGMVLLDLRLPKVDGLEVLRTVKADPALSRIPVVILTTSAAESDMARAYECQANSYLVKPVDLADFSSLMETFGFYWLAWNQYPHGAPGN
ncbi:MAG: response regulator [Holophaga sp.]|nr:response regulator [Holophaga sp.]